MRWEQSWGIDTKVMTRTTWGNHEVHTGRHTVSGPLANGKYMIAFWLMGMGKTRGAGAVSNERMRP